MTTRHRTRFARSTRLLVASTAVLLLVAACGDDDTVVSTSDGAAPPVIRLGNAPAAGATGLAAESATADRAALDPATGMIAPAFLAEFEVVGELPALDGPAQAYTLDGAGVDVGARLAEIAAVFGVVGEPRQLPADQGGGWAVGSTDYTGPTIYASDLGEMYWGYSLNATSSVRVACAEPAVSSTDSIEPALEPGASGEGTGGDPVGEPREIAADDSTSTVPGCELPAPPEGVASADESLTRTRALFADLGLDEALYRFESFGDEYYRSVSATLVLDGFATGLSFSVGFGEQGRLEYANGFLAEAVPVADYPRIGTAAAIERLEAQQGSWYPYPLVGGGDVAILESTDGGVAAEGSSGAAGGGSAGSDGSGGSETDPAGVEGSPPVAVQTAPAPIEPPVASSDPVSPDTPVESPADGSTKPGGTLGGDPSCAADAGDCVDVTLSDPPLPVPVEPVVVSLDRVEEILMPTWDADGTVWLLPGYRFFSTDSGEYDVLAIGDEYIEIADVGVPVPLPGETSGVVPVDSGEAPPAVEPPSAGEPKPAIEPEPAVEAPEPVTTTPESTPTTV